MKRPISRRVKKESNYQKQILGIIIYIDDTDGWCNVKDAKGNTYYRVTFDSQVAKRLKRVEQPVLMMPVIGNRYKYIIVSAAHRYIAATEFADKGYAQWDDGGDVIWKKGAGAYQWK